MSHIHIQRLMLIDRRHETPTAKAGASLAYISQSGRTACALGAQINDVDVVFSISIRGEFYHWIGCEMIPWQIGIDERRGGK